MRVRAPGRGPWALVPHRVRGYARGMSGGGLRVRLLAALSLVWVASLLRLRALAEMCLPPETFDRLTLHMTTVARAVGCAEGQGGSPPVVRTAVLGVAALLPLLLLTELLRAVPGALFAAPWRALVRRLLGALPEPVTTTPAVVRVRRAPSSYVPLREAVGHVDAWSHRGPPRLV